MTELAPLFLSAKVAALATLLVAAFGLPLARLLAGRAGAGRTLLEGLFLLPMVLPPTVIGFLLLGLLGRRGAIGGFLESLGLPLVFTPAAAVIASATVAFPLLYQSAKAAFVGLDPRYAAAASTLGAGRLKVFLLIELPLAAPGILGGLLLAFARAFGEFGATLMVAGNIPGLTETLPLAVYSAVESGDSPKANLLLAATVVVAFLLVIGISLSGGGVGARKRGRGAGP